jgi:hypothetical protein
MQRRERLARAERTTSRPGTLDRLAGDAVLVGRVGDRKPRRPPHSDRVAGRPQHVVADRVEGPDDDLAGTGAD